MTSTARSFKRTRGFSLLEIVIALLIASMVLAGAVGLMRFSSDEHALKKAAGEMELMAKRARAKAILQQTPYALEFQEAVVRMMPLAQAGVDGVEQPEDAETWELTLDNGMKASLRRWNSESWISLSEKSDEVWRFDPNGLCEPISVRLELGEGVAILQFNLLTGSIRDAEYTFQ